jgi:hypothetical protein
MLFVKSSLSILALAFAAGMLWTAGKGPIAVAAPETAAVERVRIPDGGIQVQAAVDAKGIAHVVYLKGDPAACDVVYARREGNAWSMPVRVNARPRAGVAAGTIRGPQLALGKSGRVHVVWFGSAQAGVKGPGGSAPLLYARLNDAGTAFEPERNLMQVSSALDGGPGVAADPAGNVYVAWQAAESAGRGEAARRLWFSRSTDDGKTFSRETPAWSQPTGACACCSTEAFVDSRGTLYVLYRMAGNEGKERDMVLLTSRDRGRTFTGARIDPWLVSTCPMSSEAFSEGRNGIAAAWETEGQVKFGKLAPAAAKISGITGAPGQGPNRKHPVLAFNHRGELLFAWTEGTGWSKGGALAWQLYDPAGKPTAVKGMVSGGIPTWGMAAVVARPDGGFLLIH